MSCLCKNLLQNKCWMLYSLFVFIRKSENPLWLFFLISKNRYKYKNTNFWKIGDACTPFFIVIYVVFSVREEQIPVGRRTWCCEGGWPHLLTCQITWIYLEDLRGERWCQPGCPHFYTTYNGLSRSFCNWHLPHTLVNILSVDLQGRIRMIKKWEESKEF